MQEVFLSLNAVRLCTPQGRERAPTQHNQQPVVFHEHRNPAQHSEHKIHASGVVFTSLETA
jgi:hypothetical protein